jgi:hypothetical protein
MVAIDTIEQNLPTVDEESFIFEFDFAETYLAAFGLDGVAIGIEKGKDECV